MKNNPVRIFDADLTAIRKDIVRAFANGAPESGSVMSWIQVAKLGAFDGHPMGPFEFTSEIFDKMVSNFNRTSNKNVPVDFEHATEMPAYAGNIPSQGAPATGWIVQLSNRGERGLWGLVQWLDPGLSYIRQGRYKFFSPAVVFDYTDGVSGENIGPVLTSGALTNRPFLDGMAAVAASRNNAETTRNSSETNKMDLDKFLKALALAMGEDSLTAETAIEKVTTMSKKVVTLSDANKKYEDAETKRKDTEAEAEVDGLIRKGIFSAAKREQLLETRKSTPEAFKVIVTAMGAKMEERSSVTRLSEKEEKTLTTQVTTTNKLPEGNVGKVDTRTYSDRVADRAEELAENDPKRFQNDKGFPNTMAYKQADKDVAKNIREGNETN